MRVIYVAGPFRGPTAWDVEQHIRWAEEQALAIWRLGAAALCPHTNSRFFHGAAPEAVWLDGYLEMLSRCDAVLMVDEWRNSAGAQAEHRAAEVQQKPVFYSICELSEWLKELE